MLVRVNQSRHIHQPMDSPLPNPFLVEIFMVPHALLFCPGIHVALKAQHRHRGNRRRQLVIAAALAIAEIERIDRLFIAIDRGEGA